MNLFYEKLLTIKELAAELPANMDGRPRSRGYVHAMKKYGFPMTDNMATLSSAILWLQQHPEFAWSRVYGPDKDEEE